jgi:glycosyltransferase involved in cell wall biosynthesis
MISVVICTFNRAALLQKAIESIIDQTLSKSDYEIIIVDNNSQDCTLDLLKEIQFNISQPKIKFVTEVKQGLAFARNTGVRHSQGTYVAFMDDDACADSKWLETALDLFKNIQPIPIVLGGPILPFYDSIKPSWFKDSYESRTWGDKSRFLKPPESFSGSNMIFRKEIIDKYGGFNEKVGMTGDYISVGEETDLFINLWSNYGDSLPMFYSPDLIIYHIVEQYKMTVGYQLKRAFASGQSWYFVNRPKSFFNKIRLILGLTKTIGLLVGLALIGLFKYCNSKNWVVEMIGPIMSNVGILGSCFGIYIFVKQRQK